MKKILLQCLLAGIGYSLYAVGTPADTTAHIYRVAQGDITVDGNLNDPGWANAIQYDVVKVFKGDVITDPSDLSGWFKAAWTNAGLYVAISVTDNIHYSMGDFGEAWEKDKAEIYLNMNTDALHLGKGAGAASGHGEGYFQIAPVADPGQGAPDWAPGSQLQILLNVDDSAKYTEEVFLPWTGIPDTDSAVYNPASGIKFGFDVTLVDNDGPDSGKPARRRLCWMNNAEAPSVDENWNNMAYAGFMQPGIYTAISQTQSHAFTISVDHQTLRLTDVAPGTIAVFDMMGRCIVKINSHGSEAEIDISALQSGVYIVRSENNAVKFFKR